MKEKLPRNKAANRAVEFINNLTGSGDFDGTPFKLRPWQESIVRKIFGTIKKDGTRQYKKCFLFLPRKNGKSTLVAACALAELFSGRAGQQIIIVAADKNQSGQIFNLMMTMLRHPSAKMLNDLIKPNHNKQMISYPDKNSFVVALAGGDPGSKLGYNPSTIIIDEFLTQTDRELWTTITSGAGTRIRLVYFYNQHCW